jgi:hypothetical protein
MRADIRQPSVAIRSAHPDLQIVNKALTYLPPPSLVYYLINKKDTADRSRPWSKKTVGEHGSPCPYPV